MGDVPSGYKTEKEKMDVVNNATNVKSVKTWKLGGHRHGSQYKAKKHENGVWGRRWLPKTKMRPKILWSHHFAT